MSEPIYAVIDTNVIVSALLTRNPSSPTVVVVEYLFDHRIIPVYNDEILEEYREVLSRSKFKFDTSVVDNLVSAIEKLGISMHRTSFHDALPDPKDKVFYEISVTNDSYLVTGNIKHFPKSPKVVTPAEIVEIINDKSSCVPSS